MKGDCLQLDQIGSHQPGGATHHNMVIGREALKTLHSIHIDSNDLPRANH